jgi:prevent-host-death family protein
MTSLEASSIGGSNANFDFTQLLARVATGEEITITDHGNPIARLVPVRPPSTVEQRSEAIRQMDALAARNSLNGLQIRDLIAEGRR